MGGDSEVVVCVRVCMWSVCVLNIEINHSQLTFILPVLFCFVFYKCVSSVFWRGEAGEDNLWTG